MFGELYENLSLLFYWRWPTVEGVITAADLIYGRYPAIVIVYEFSVGEDGPYTGQSRSPFWFGSTNVNGINKQLAAGERVLVRYRPNQPSVNKLDSSVWRDLEDGL